MCHDASSQKVINLTVDIRYLNGESSTADCLITTTLGLARELFSFKQTWAFPLSKGA
jgi:hypothetical protein